MQLTEAQGKAIHAIKDWFSNRTKEQQVFRVFGYAGTGKTTITKHAIADLGLDMDSPEVRFAAFTGKAAYVMRKHGTPARTIHSLVYCVSEATEEEIEAAKDKLKELEAQVSGMTGIEQVMARSQIQALRSEIINMKKPRFGLNEESEIRDCELLVLDEVSMVGPDMAADILSFGKPVLVLGDPGQLPPIRGEGAFTQQKPDIMLTEIHRQAEESAIIRLATMARKNEPIPYGKHDDFVWKMRRNDVQPKNLLNADQVICGRNATRLDLCNHMRAASGFNMENPFPESEAEKVICLRNDNSRGLINGMFLKVLDAKSNGKTEQLYFSAKLETEEGVKVGFKNGSGDYYHDVYSGHFHDHIAFDKDRGERDWKAKKGMVEATFGYAITCHKSQGSSWPNIIVWDDHLGRTSEDRAKWLYTAITRAQEGLVILD